MPKSCGASQSDERRPIRVDPLRFRYQATLIMEQLSPLPIPINAT